MLIFFSWPTNKECNHPNYTWRHLILKADALLLESSTVGVEGIAREVYSPASYSFTLTSLQKSVCFLLISIFFGGSDSGYGLILGSWFCLKYLFQVLVLACLYPSNIRFTPSEPQEVRRVNKTWFIVFRSSKISKFLGGGAEMKGHYWHPLGRTITQRAAYAEKTSS